MTTRASNPAPVREALYALSLAKQVPDADLLDSIIRQFPEHADALTAFAVDLALDALRLDPDIPSTQEAFDGVHVSPGVSRAMSRFLNRLHAVAQSTPSAAAAPRTSVDVINPFAALDRAMYRAFAAAVGVNNVFVSKLRDRQIRPDTIPASFRKLAADTLHVPVDLLVAHLGATPAFASASGQFFKADNKPSMPLQQTFTEAVGSSGLTEEQQRKLLSA